MKKIAISIFVFVFVGTLHAQLYLDPNAPVEERVKDALSRMTLHEKVALCHAQSKFTVSGVPRLGIKEIHMSDGPHGCREEIEWNTWNHAMWTNDSVVAFPSLTCLTATWNRNLSGRYGKAVAEEFAFRDKHMILGPGTTIARMPLNGRSFEYMGEDPYLAGEMVVPYIQSAQAQGVACCLKHFFLNNQETRRDYVNVNVSERAVNEIYLPAFKKAVQKANVWSMMGSYNKWLNVNCSQNDSLLNGIVKRQWGFDGAIVSDWGATHDTWQAATGGLDIEMGTYTKTPANGKGLGYNMNYLADPFEQLIKEVKIPMSTLDDKAARVLRIIFRTAMNPKRTTGFLCNEDHYNACREIGEEGIVLMKNNKNILPIDGSKYKHVLIVGENATRSLTEGGGSSELKTKYDASPLEYLTKIFTGATVEYAQGYDSGRPQYASQEKSNADKLAQLKAEALEKAKQSDLIIFVGGLNKNGHQDCEGVDRKEYCLSFGQPELIEELAKIQKNIIVVTFGGNPFETSWAKNVQAFVHCWYLGSMAGESLANVLTGRVNPSGKLPVTWAKRLEDYPCFQYGEEGYPGVNDQVYYKEGIYVGYRYFDTNKLAPAYPFGYGLSYTSFLYDKPTISHDASTGKWTISLTVRNTGHFDGKETIQLYVGKKDSKIDRPAKELKDFAKISLNPNETKTVTFQLSADDLKYFDESVHDWVFEPGTYTAYIGSSSTDIRHNCSLKFQ